MTIAHYEDPRTSILQTELRIAARLADTDFVPGKYRGNPNQVLAILLTGLGLGLDEMTSLREIDMRDGEPILSAVLQEALALRDGHTVDYPIYTRTRVVVRGRRVDTGRTLEVEWTLDDAIRAGLVKADENGPRSRSRDGKPLPWETYTRAMLRARAVTELCRALFPDSLCGRSYYETPAVRPLRVRPVEIDGRDVREVPACEADPDEETSEAPLTETTASPGTSAGVGKVRPVAVAEDVVDWVEEQRAAGNEPVALDLTDVEVVTVPAPNPADPDEDPF